MTRYKKQQGFTIIEVVLVLAIAALIFLMVFVAFPALQRSQRDQARKNAVGTTLSAVTDYAGTHRGQLPTTTAALAPFVDELTTSNYTVTVVSNQAAGSIPGQTADAINVYNGLQCEAPEPVEGETQTGEVLVAGSGRQYAVVTLLETGDTVYCQNG